MPLANMPIGQKHLSGPGQKIPTIWLIIWTFIFNGHAFPCLDVLVENLEGRVMTEENNIVFPYYK